MQFTFNVFSVYHVLTTVSATPDQTIVVESTTDTVLVCGIPGTYTYPKWGGPPFTGTMPTFYTSGVNFNPHMDQDKRSRLSWADNKRDMKLRNVARVDEGTYECYYNDNWLLQINVRGR